MEAIYCVVSLTWGGRILGFYPNGSDGSSLLISCQTMVKLITQYGFHGNFHSDMSNSTNMVVRFDEKSSNLCLCLRARSHIIYATQVGCSICHPAKF